MVERAGPVEVERDRTGKSKSVLTLSDLELRSTKDCPGCGQAVVEIWDCKLVVLVIVDSGASEEAGSR
jgi:hypothetical protein